VFVDVVFLDKDGSVDSSGDSSDARLVVSAVVAFNNPSVSFADSVASSHEPSGAECASGCILFDTVPPD